ncbi:MAG: glycosyltransferase family 4 protein [Rhodothermales bacterium]|nr:glycosyltransferase family 4 protein [Rhodothermales bacterium]
MPSPPPFRILMALDHAFPPDVRVENEALSLIEAGFEVGLLAIGPDDRPARAVHRGIHLFRDPLPAPVRNKLRGLAGTVPLLTWYLARRVGQVYREFRFDALHVHDLYLFGGGLRAARRLGVPLVGDLHENWVEALKHYAWSTRFPGRLVVSIPRWERVERRWVNAVDRLVVVIEEARARNLALGVDPEKIVVVPNTIRLDDFAEYAVEDAVVEAVRSPLTVTYTGGFDVHRGLASVIDAMPRVLEAVPGARLVLVGDGRIRGELEAQAASRGLGAAVRFEGWQPQARLKSYLLGSDVGLVPHLKTVHTDATIPHKLFHYMYLARPVVVSDCRPLARIVGETQAGLVYPAGDPEALAAAILRLAADREAAAAMGRRGRAAVQERYHWAHTVQGLVQMYEGLHGQRQGSR